MTTTTINVDGMTCGHCAQAVTSELSALSGVTDVAVDLHANEVSPVTITSTGPLAQADIAAAIDEAGYSIV